MAFPKSIPVELERKNTAKVSLGVRLAYARWVWLKCWDSMWAYFQSPVGFPLRIVGSIWVGVAGTVTV